MGKQHRYRPFPGTHFLLTHFFAALHHTNIQTLSFLAGLTITEINIWRFFFLFLPVLYPLCSANWL